jgi:hypothetical protein
MTMCRKRELKAKDRWMRESVNVNECVCFCVREREREMKMSKIDK